MDFCSVCSGIEAASEALTPIGFSASWFSEIAPFPCAVLAHHHPDVPNLGDMTVLPALVRSHAIPAPSILIGGTPCQSFSVAGMRKGLEDPRGNLTMTFVDLADAIDEVRPEPCVVWWENVPGILGHDDNVFGTFLGALAGDDVTLEPGPLPAARKSSRVWGWSHKHGRHVAKWPVAGCVYGPKRAIAWRVLDAQYFGLAQRRKRVFVMASARNGFDPTAVLFEREGVRRDTPPSRGPGEDAAAGVGRSLAFGGGRTGGPVDVAACLTARGQRIDFEVETFALAVALRGREGGATAELGDDIAGCLRASGGGGDKPHVLAQSYVRRLTPTECERLQGFPDGHTLVSYRSKPAADGPRYAALGNSMAVPVMRWIGERLKWQM